MKNILSEFSLSGIALLFFVYLLPTNPDLVRNQLANGLTFSCVVFAIFVTRSLDLKKAPALICIGTLSYFLIHATHPWGNSNLINDWRDYLAASSFGFLLSVILLVTVLRSTAPLFNCLAVLCFASSCVLLCKKLMGVPPAFFMNNPAGDAAILAALYPILAFRPHRVFGGKPWLTRLVVITPILAIAVTGSSTGALGLVVAVFAWVLATRRNPSTYGVLVLATFGSIAGLVLFAPDNVFSGNGRLPTWRRSMIDWWENVNVWWGSSTGSFFLEGPKLQVEETCRLTPSLCDPVPHGQALHEIFASMHNDYLQILREQGIIGLGLFLTISIVAMRKAFDRPWLFSALFTYGTIMVTQFPMRYFGSAFIGLLLLREALQTPGREGK